MIMTKLSFAESFSHPFTEDYNLLSLSLPLEGCYIQGGLDKFAPFCSFFFFFLDLIWIFSVHSLNTVNAFLREKVKVKVIEEFFWKNSNFSNDCLFWHGWRENLAGIQEIYIYMKRVVQERECWFLDLTKICIAVIVCEVRVSRVEGLSIDPNRRSTYS